LGFSKDLLSTDVSAARPLPGLILDPDGHPSFGARLPAPARVPPLPFLPASTVSSVRLLAGLLRPATSHEVRPVSDLSAMNRFCALPHITHTASILPGCAFTPSRAFPSPSAVPRHRGPCLPAVLLPASRLFSFDESVVATRCCHLAGPDALLGFVPLQGSPRSTWLGTGGSIRTRSRPGRDHRWLVPRLFGLDPIHPWQRPESPQTDTITATSHGLFLTAPAEAPACYCTRSNGLADRPSKIFQVQVVAFFLLVLPSASFAYAPALQFPARSVPRPVHRESREGRGAR